ncbi:MAG: YgdI/YgdR family lipoprotein [Chloroflexi bacterium]|nr:YgdI/YgdR family lipoprotein [Chloroflexota bacterium]
MKRALAMLLAAVCAATLVACSPEAMRTRNGGPGADVGNHSRSLPEPSTAPPISGS